MEFRSFNNELGVCNIMFRRLFQNIQIERTDLDGNKYLVPVNCVIDQKSRILKGLANPDRRGMMKLPIIAITRTGFQRNGERLNDMNNEIKYEINSYRRVYSLMTPVPVDVSYDVVVMAKYPQDIDKIASNFMVFFNSDVYVGFRHPKFSDIQMNCQIVMQDSVNEEHSGELDGSQDDVVTATFQFTFKTYLFAGSKPLKAIKPTIISTWLSTVLSNVVTEIKPDQIDDFQKKNPYSSVSAYTPRYVESTLSTEVPNPNISDDVYDDIPTIERIDFGFYPTYRGFDMEEYMLCVDNGGFTDHAHFPVSGYLSSDSYGTPQLSVYADAAGNDVSSYPHPVSTHGDHTGQVSRYCTFEPYVDRLYWKIDLDSKLPFPNNVVLVRD